MISDLAGLRTDTHHSWDRPATAGDTSPGVDRQRPVGWGGGEALGGQGTF